MAKRILLADNDPTFLNTRRKFLEEQGYRVIPAATAVEARRILEQGGVDLGILDIRLENNRNGNDVSGLIVAKETDRTIPKIILTSFPTYEAAREVMGDVLDGAPAAVNFISKLEGMDAFLRAVRNALQRTERSFRATQDEIATQLNQDYEQARKEARAHYRINLVASLVFSIPIIVGTLLVLRGTLAAGTAIAVAGVVMEVAHYLFASRLNVAHRRVDRYHEELLQTKRLENLLAAIEKIDNERERGRCVANIIETTAHYWIGGSKAQTNKPAPPKSEKRIKPRQESAQ